jgi:hypothetical protein
MCVCVCAVRLCVRVCGAQTHNIINNKEIGSGLRALVSSVRKRVCEHMSASERASTGEEEEEEEADKHVLGVGEGGKDAGAQGLQGIGGLEVMWIFPATQVVVCVRVCGSVGAVREWTGRRASYYYNRYYCYCNNNDNMIHIHTYAHRHTHANRTDEGRQSIDTLTHTYTHIHTHTHTQEERRRAAVYRDLWAKGFWVTEGLKFGATFLAYPV